MRLRKLEKQDYGSLGMRLQSSYKIPHYDNLGWGVSVHKCVCVCVCVCECGCVGVGVGVCVCVCTQGKALTGLISVFCTFSLCCRSANIPEIMRLFPQVKVKHIPGAGHWLHHDRPEEFLEIVGEFVRS